MKLSAEVFTADDMEAAVELCYQQRWTDGLPVVPPTRHAVERMIAWLGRDPDEEIGIIPPRDGVATIEAICINCVMAGCKPEYVPVVIAAVRAMLKDGFNLNGVQTTTHGCAPLVIVSGALVKELGFNTKEGAFGHGCRPSAAIGRAVRLILWNLGGGFPGEPCKTTQGHPGYYSFCVAEDEESNPWETLQLEHGFGAQDTCVTVTGVEGPHLIATGAGQSSAESVLGVIAESIALLGSQAMTGGDVVIALNPLAAKNLSSAGLSKADVKSELVRLARRPVRDMKRRLTVSEAHPGHWMHTVDVSDDEALVPFIRSPDNLVIFVTGGWDSRSGYSSICSGWGLRGGFTQFQRVELPQRA